MDGQRKIRVLAGGMLAVSLVGFLDAAYLAYAHYTHSPLKCPRGIFGIPFDSCGKVTESAYSMILGIPVPLWGMGYYILIAALALVFFATREERVITSAARLTAAGVAASAWFVYAQVALLGAVCLYCLFSTVTSTALFVLGMLVLFFSRRRDVPFASSGGLNS